MRKTLTELLPGTYIPITFVVCQSQQQGFKMVPSEAIRDFRGRTKTNVNSCTALQCGDSSNSYYLVAQGGLKGTSKPVKHIVIINENERPVDGCIGLEQTQQHHGGGEIGKRIIATIGSGFGL
jgi:hypothetical protein